jgi:AraC-like DNA-binding protein
MSNVSSYRELAPPGDLAAVVTCLWVHEVGSEGRSQRVIPDGCTDIIWVRDELVVAGPATAPVIVPVAPSSTTVGIRFRPGAASAAFGMPASELRDQSVPLAEVWPDDAEPFSEQLASSDGARATIATLLRNLTDRLRRAEPDPLVVAGARVLDRPGSRVRDLAPAIGIGERHLRRRFHDAVGYGPKTLDRVLRLHRFLDAAEGPDGPQPLAVAAASAGYADQAHLSRDCAVLTGLTPGALLAERAA